MQWYTKKKIKEGAKDLANYESDFGSKGLSIRYVEFVKHNFSEQFIKSLIFQVNNLKRILLCVD